MKRKYAAALAAALTLSVLSGCQAAPVKNSLTPVTLNEVAHSIFYAPQYAAIELGYFEEEGIDLTLVNGAGADKVMTALVSGDADIGFMGSEASIYTYAGGAEDYAVNFAQLTQRAGNFLVGHEADEDFTWEKLKGKKVLGGRAGGVPDYDVIETCDPASSIPPSAPSPSFLRWILQCRASPVPYFEYYYE